MGRSKADLPFGSETMLQRVVRRLSQVVNHIVVVAAKTQEVGDLASVADCEVRVARDSLEFAGPLAGLHVGLGHLAAVETNICVAYLTSCDVPFLNVEFVRELIRQIEDFDVVVPYDEQHLHPLAAGYRISVLDKVRSLLSEGERRPRTLFDQVRTRRIGAESLESSDPGLRTLLNLNSSADYRAALEAAGLPVPDWVGT